MSEPACAQLNAAQLIPSGLKLTAGEHPVAMRRLKPMTTGEQTKGRTIRYETTLNQTLSKTRRLNAGYLTNIYIPVINRESSFRSTKMIPYRNRHKTDRTKANKNNSNEPNKPKLSTIQARKSQHSQLLPKLWRILGGSKRINEPLKSRNRGVDLENTRSNGLRRILLSINVITPGLRQRASRLEILEAHICSKNFPRKKWGGFSGKP